MSDQSIPLVKHVGHVDSLSVATSICLTYTLLIFGLRLYIRNNSYGIDDGFVTFATLAALGHFGTAYALLAAGLGKPYDMLQGSLSSVNNAAVGGIITFMLSIYLAKIATLIFMMRISSVTRSRPLYYTCIGITVVFCLASILIATVDCSLSLDYYWNLAGNSISCPTQAVRWQVITALDVASEIVLLVLPVKIVWNLQMPRDKKVIVVGTFWTRIPVIGLSVIRQIYVQRLLRASTDKSLSSTLTVILMEIEITYALASCTIATSRSFTDNFNTGWGMGQLRGAAEEYNLSNLGSGSRTMRKGTINMDTHTATITAGADKDMYPMVNRGRSVSLHRILNEGPQRDRNGMILRPEQNLHNESFVRSGRSGSEDGKSISGDSDELHILRQTEYSVSHDEAPILSRIHPLR